MTRSITHAILPMVGLLVCASTAQAQFGKFLEKLVPGAPGASAPADAGPATQAQPAPIPSAAMVDGAPAVGPRAGVQAELAPDRQCSRPRERFNVAEKLVEYGGTEAQLRMERLIKSDFKYQDLTPQDRQMLQYIAQTTVWVPVEVESTLGKAFEVVASRTGEPPDEADEILLEDVRAKLDTLKSAVPDFPGSIKLVLDAKLADGASAKFGGVVVLSKRFLETMAEQPAGADFVLAHELSHVYKRHAVKHMQFTMISTEEGWELGKKVLGRAMQGTQTNVIQDGVFTLTTVPKLVDFVRKLQLKFNGEQELEADACSSVWMRAKGIDPGPAWDAFEAAFAATAAPAGGYATTHPPTAERRANFKSKAGKPGAPPKTAGPQKPAAGPKPAKAKGPSDR